VQAAVAHDWLVRYGGAERCVEELLAAFPGAAFLTTVLDPEGMPASLCHAKTSFLQSVPGAVQHYEWFLPLMPLAWRLNRVPEPVDIVISSSHACAKAVVPPDGVPHLSYCHTPMRYAWDFEAEKDRFPSMLVPAVRRSMALFRSWDRSTARRVTRFLANSRAVADRIRRFYARDADIVYPPVRTDIFTPGAKRGDDFLYVGRLVSYKRPDVAVQAFQSLPHRLLVVGDGHMRPRLEAVATPNVRFLGTIDESRLLELYRSCRALVYPANEDFGIVMAEAQACGTAVIALDAGGARDIVDDRSTGWLVPEQTPEAFRAAVLRAAEEELDAGLIRIRAERFSAERFRAEMRRVVEETVSARDETG
jgi:glycosyltransferase involved in cell wall biosynthesis